MAKSNFNPDEVRKAHTEGAMEGIIDVPPLPPSETAASGRAAQPATPPTETGSDGTPKKVPMTIQWDGDVYDYLKIISDASGMSYTRYVNQLARKDMEEHGEVLELMERVKKVMRKKK